VKAVILAAGRGTRLRPLTDTCPKPLVPIGGHPLLAYVVSLLARHGFDNLMINLHHLPDRIRASMGDGSRWGVRIDYSLERQLLGTAGAVRRVADWIGAEPFLVYYGDNLTNFDLTDLLNAHRAGGALATIGLLWMDEPTTRGIVNVDATGRIDRWIEKPSPAQVFPDYLVNAGTYMLEPGIIARIPAYRASDFAVDVFPALMADGVPLCGHRMRGELLSTDTPERYAYARRQVESGAFIVPRGDPT
jgi:mannose-1-phosphate guanylyltransferase